MDKTCIKCSETKPLSDFVPRKLKSGQMGYRGECRSCWSKKQTENKRIRDKQKAEENWIKALEGQKKLIKSYIERMNL